MIKNIGWVTQLGGFHSDGRLKMVVKNPGAVLNGAGFSGSGLLVREKDKAEEIEGENRERGGESSREEERF